MATQSMWHQNTNIWLVLHAGIINLEEARDAILAPNLLQQKSPICILIDLTEAIYPREFLEISAPDPNFTQFLNRTEVQHIAFVIPGGENDPLQKSIRANQEMAGRLHKVSFLKTRPAALSHLLSINTADEQDGAET